MPIVEEEGDTGSKQQYHAREHSIPGPPVGDRCAKKEMLQFEQGKHTDAHQEAEVGMLIGALRWSEAFAGLLPKGHVKSTCNTPTWRICACLCDHS